MEYLDFIKNKAMKTGYSGFQIEKDQLNRGLFDWQKDVIIWALKKGRCALFQDCGMGKTVEQLAWAEKVCQHTGKPVLILAPLAVVNQTVKEAEKFGLSCKEIREQCELDGVCVANYEILESFDFSVLGGIVLDESSILKNFTGKTKKTLTERCAETPFRLCCTATPSPNDYTELGNHSEFLGIMSRKEMLSTFFVHDGGNTSNWRLKGHAKEAFFVWIASWACCMTNPEDLGYDGTQYRLPELRVHERIVKSEKMEGSDGQMMLFAPSVQTLSQRRDARRNSLELRCAEAAAIANSSQEQCLLWCDLNDESTVLSHCVENCVEVRGSDSREKRTARVNSFTTGESKCLVSKPSIAGWGMNWQHCHRMVFVGLSDSFEAYYQAIRRCWRFGQTDPVEVYLVVSDAEGAVKANIERKQAEVQAMTKELVKYTKDILADEIKATQRMTETYFAENPMKVPEWLKEEIA